MAIETDYTYPSKNLIIHQLDPREEWVAGDKAVVVVRHNAVLDAAHHGRRDGGVVHVAAHGARRQVPEYREREREPSRVYVHIWKCGVDYD